MTTLTPERLREMAAAEWAKRDECEKHAARRFYEGYSSALRHVADLLEAERTEAIDRCSGRSGQVQQCMREAAHEGRCDWHTVAK